MSSSVSIPEIDDTADSYAPDGSDEAKARRIWARMRQAQEKETTSRLLSARDYAFYENDQWEDPTLDRLRAKNRPALTINITKETVDTVMGLFESNKIDMQALPVGESDNEGANIVNAMLKEVDEQCDGDAERMDALADAVKGGIGWLEIDIRDRDNLRDNLAEGIEGMPYWRRVDPEMVYRDPLSRRADGSDMRWVVRLAFVDLDEGQAMFSKHAKELEGLLMNRSDALRDWNNSLQTEYSRPDRYGSVPDWISDGNSFIDNQRNQLLLVECQYHAIEDVQMMVTENGLEEYDGKNPAHQELVHLTNDGDLDVMFPVVKRKVVKSAITCGPLLLQDERINHRHNCFTLLPIIAHIDRMGNTFGIIRQMIDSQKDYNKRRSMSLVLLTAMQVLYEQGAVKDVKQLAKLATDPNAIIEVTKNALAEKRIEFRRETELAQGHVQIMNIAKEELQHLSGVNRETRGQGPGDMSGVAMQERKESAMTTLMPIFSNYKRSMKRGAYMVWSLCRQYVTAPMMLRITEAAEPDAVRFINTDTGMSLADIKVNFTITSAPATATTRQANLNILMQLVQKLPPEVVMQLLPKLIKAHEIPDRNEIVAAAERALAQMGMMPPMQPGNGQQMPSPGGGGSMPGVPQGAPPVQAVKS